LTPPVSRAQANQRPDSTPDHLPVRLHADARIKRARIEDDAIDLIGTDLRPGEPLLIETGMVFACFAFPLWMRHLEHSWHT